MHNKELLEGNKAFREKKVQKLQDKLVNLADNGQTPKALFIGCCDSRVVPNLITLTDPGDLFITRNIGNFVPPYSPNVEYLATASAIEYAVSALGVKDIIVCGHSHCGAIAGLYTGDQLDDKKFINVKKWLKLGERAKNYVEQNIDKDVSGREKLEMTEKISAVFQLDNLMTYPTVKEAVKKGELTLNAWHYDIKTAKVECYDKKENKFVLVE